jgi:hypothetical protein
MAEGKVVGLIIDGARIASPGLLAIAKLAMLLADRPIVATPGYHLGRPDTWWRGAPATTN